MKMFIPQTNWSMSRNNYTPFDDFYHLVESFLQPTYANTVSFQPTCDVSETKDHYLVSFDMPGVKNEDIKIEVKENQLMISGERL